MRRPMSVVSSIRNARENARAFRETLTLEAFTLLNATWQLAKESTDQINDMIKSESAPLIISLRSVLEEMQKAIALSIADNAPPDVAPSADSSGASASASLSSSQNKAFGGS